MIQFLSLPVCLLKGKGQNRLIGKFWLFLFHGFLKGLVPSMMARVGLVSEVYLTTSDVFLGRKDEDD